MSEKRFHQFGLWVIDDPNLKINTVADLFDTKIMSIEEVVELLNTLHQENQQLKHYKLYEDNKRLQTIIADLKEENEELRKELKEIKENPINYF